MRFRASQMMPISAADDPQRGRDGLDVGAVGEVPLGVGWGMSVGRCASVGVGVVTPIFINSVVSLLSKAYVGGYSKTSRLFEGGSFTKSTNSIGSLNWSTSDTVIVMSPVSHEPLAIYV